MLFDWFSFLNNFLGAFVKLLESDDPKGNVEDYDNDNEDTHSSKVGKSGSPRLFFIMKIMIAMISSLSFLVAENGCYDGMQKYGDHYHDNAIEEPNVDQLKVRCYGNALKCLDLGKLHHTK